MAKVRFTAPDGRSGSIDVPDDWSQDRIAQEIDFGLKLRPSVAPSEPATKPARVPIHETLLSAIAPSQETRDFFANKAKIGVSKMADFPLTVIDMVTNPKTYANALSKLLPFSGPAFEPVPDVSGAGAVTAALTGRSNAQGLAGQASNAVQQLLGAQPDQRNPNMLTQGLGNAIEMGISGLPFGVMGIARAPYKGLAASGEVMSALAGGAGKEVGGTVTESLGYGREPGEFAGGLAGGIAGGMSPIVASKALAARTDPRISAENLSGTRAGREIKKAIESEPGSATNLSQSLQTQREVQDLGGARFRPNLAQATGSGAVADIQGGVLTRDPVTHGTALSAEEASRKALDQAKQAAFPAGSNPAGAAANKLRIDQARIDKLLDQVDEQRAALGARGSDVNLENTGASIRMLRDEAFAKARATKTSLYENAYEIADKNNVRVKLDDTVDNLKALRDADENAFQNLPSALKKVLEKYAPREADQTGRYVPPDLAAEAQKLRGGGTADVSFKELHSAIRETNRQFFNATDDTQRYLLGKVKDQLSQKVEQLKAPEFGGVGQAIREADDFYKNTYRRAFKEGVGGMMDATARGKYGEILPDSRVVQRVLTPEGVDDYFAMAGQTPQAMKVLKDGVLGLFMRAKTVDGLITKNGVDAFVRQHKDAIAKIPGMESTLRNMDELGAALLERQASLREARKALDNGVLAKFAGAKDADEVAALALTDDKAFRRLVGLANQSQRSGLLRALADRIPMQAEKAGMTPIEFVARNEATLRPVLDSIGPDHFKNLKTLMSGETILDRASVPKHTNIRGVSQTDIEQVTGSSPRTIWSQSANAAAERQTHATAFLHLLSRFGIKRGAEKIMAAQQELIENPELVRAMLRQKDRSAFDAKGFASDAMKGGNSVEDHMLRAFIRTMNTMQGSQESP